MNESQKTVLLIDDDSSITEILRVRCESIGLRVKVAHSVVHAARELDRELPDLVCVDVNLPPGNGLVICAAMAEDDRASKIPVIVLTGRNDRQTMEACQSLCAYHLLKSDDLWKRMEPVLYELIDMEVPSRQRTRSTDEETHKLE